MRQKFEDSMWTQGWRDRIWSELDHPWDLIVVGGGITGAGIMREAARAGLRVLLLEAGDYASGTSSRSSKLVHGGLRYLRQGQIRMILASVREREQLLNDGKGLVNPLAFLYVNFDYESMPRWLFGLGLTIYDLLGLRWGHERCGPDRLRELAPHLTGVGHSGGYCFLDAQTDDARLVLRVIREGVRDGGMAMNYVRAEGLLRSRDGQVQGVAVRDLAPDGAKRTAEIWANVVVNATGAWADKLRTQVGGVRRLRCLQGSHLVFPAHLLPLTRAVSFAHPVDKRPVFAVPWEGVTLFGTTDVDYVPSDSEPTITPAELDYLMTAARNAFPSLDLGDEDIQATFSGIRAVEDTGRLNPSKEPREHVLWDENGLLTVAGGKLTTFRIMAKDALKKVRTRFPGQPRFHNGRILSQPPDLLDKTNLNQAKELRLAGRYGLEAPELVATANPDELSSIGQSVALWAELRWAARAEGVVHLDDLLLRRLRLGILLPEGGLPWIDRIRAIAQPELGWDDRRWEEEVAAYTRRWCSAYGAPSTPSNVGSMGASR
jgi:glycerol-3-phosphate dehydrogenase